MNNWLYRLRLFFFKRALHKRNPLSKNTPSAQIVRPHHILLLHHLSEHGDAHKLHDFIQKIQSPQSTLTTVLYCNVSKPMALPKSHCITPADLKWNLVPRPAIAQPILQQSYDLLINLAPAMIPPLHYIALHANAQLKIGLYTSSEPLYDLTIDIAHQRQTNYPSIVYEILRQLSVRTEKDLR